MGVGRGGLTITALVLALVAAACTDGGGGSASVATTSGRSSSERDSTSPEADLAALFEGAGVTIVEDLASAPPMTGLQVWSWQLENMEREVDRGGGFLGAELDDLAGAPAGVPFSYLLAGWITSGVSETSDQVLALMGDQDWENAPGVIFPKAALTLFVADAMAAATTEGPQAAATGQLASFARQGETVCETVVGWVNDALDFIVEVLKIDSDADGWIGFFVTVWNATVDLARDAVEGLISTITAPVVSVLTDALVVIGTLSMVSSLLTPWGADLAAARPVTRVALGDEPDIEGRFTLTVDTNIDFEWPDEIEGCARVAGLELPDPTSAEGSPVDWETWSFPPLATSRIPEIGTVTASDDEIASDNTATLHWVTGHQETDDGERMRGSYSATAIVTSREAVKLRKMIVGFIEGKVPDDIPFAADIEGLLEELLAPALDKLVEFSQVRGDASTAVEYYFERDSDGTSLTIFNPQTGCELEDVDSTFDSAAHQLVYPDRTLGDGRMDDVEYLIRVDGIDADKAVGLVLEIGGDELGRFLDWTKQEQARTGGPLRPVPKIEIPIGAGTQVDEDTWTYRGSMPLGYDLRILDGVVMWARVKFADSTRVFESKDLIAVEESFFSERRDSCWEEPAGIRIDIGPSTDAVKSLIVDGTLEIVPMIGHREFTISVAPSMPACRIKTGVPFESNPTDCSFTIEYGPDFFVGKVLSADEIQGTLFYAWHGPVNVDEAAAFVGVVEPRCFDQSWFFRIFETGVMIGYPEGLVPSVMPEGSAVCVERFQSVTTEYGTTP